MKSISVSFHEQQRLKQINWRKKNISTAVWGWQNKRLYEHIIPKHIWKETLWAPIRTPLENYLKAFGISSHTGTHNLLSSWVLCANLYFPIRINPLMRYLMTQFLKEKISPAIESLDEIELEYALDGKLHPSTLLGESDGSRGSGQTSPDVAFLVNTSTGKGLVLTESKYTEHSFYRCSARTTTGSLARIGNPDPKRCMVASAGNNYCHICHQNVWGRKYWNNLSISAYGDSILKCCPAATAGYQLFRQHALASGILNSGSYDFVSSTVAYDERNTDLNTSFHSTGITNFQLQWGKIFNEKVIFSTWTHQDWVSYVRSNHNSKACIEFVRTNNNFYSSDNESIEQFELHIADWLDYVNKRYGY